MGALHRGDSDRVGMYWARSLPADAAAADVWANRAIGIMPIQGNGRAIQRITITPSAAVAFNAANFFTLTFTSATGTVATVDLSAVSWVAGTPVTLTLGAVQTMLANQTLRVAKTVAGLGLIMPDCLVAVEFFP